MDSSAISCALQLLSVVTLLPVQLISIQAYPITSNPIEWTAKNWAWQSWAKQTSEEQSKGNPRKVTTKSIFAIPYRYGCPPGQHLDGKRCIPTVSIDQKEWLNQQVLTFVGDANIGGNMEFEYEDETGSAIASDGLGFETQFNIYDAPQKFSDEAPTNFDNNDKLSGQDAPLKLNFFEQDLPINENETMTFDSMPMAEFELPAKPAESSNSTVTIIDKPANQTLLNSTVNIVNNTNINNKNDFIEKNILNESNKTINIDLLSESSNISTNVAYNKSVEPISGDRTLFISNIDAISLSAHVPRRPPHISLEYKKPQEMELTTDTQMLSIYRGDSGVKLIDQDHGNFGQVENSPTNTELAELFEADALLPLGFKANDAIFTETKEFNIENISKNDAERIMPENQEEFEGDVSETFVMPEKEKTDHIRSVSESSLLPLNELEAQEYEFTTTLEPDATTSFQLDDTTIIEEPHPPTNELQELLLSSTTDNLRKKQEQAENQVNVEKLKVKPVKNEFTFVDNDYVMQETTTIEAAIEATTEIETSTLPPLPKTPQEQHQSEIINEGVHMNVDENRFDYQVDIDNLMDMPTSTIATEITSEGIISALNQDIIIPTTIASETDLEALNDRKYMNKLNNNEMVSTTTILQHSDKESLLNTKADVFVNNNGNDDADTAGEIVFMVVNKQKTETAASNNVMESLDTSTAATTITTTTTTTRSPINKENKITERTTSKRWSKVMPIFDISSTTISTMATKEAVHLVDETTSKLQLKEGQPISTSTVTTTSTVNVPTLAPITEIVTTKSSSISISEKRKSSNRRNSKIIRLDKYPIAANVNILSEATKQSTRMTTTIPTLFTTTKVVTETKTTTTTPATKNSNSYIDPFWWIPSDWHLDRHDDVEGRPLLLRLWASVTSDSEAKV